MKNSIPSLLGALICVALLSGGASSGMATPVLDPSVSHSTEVSEEMRFQFRLHPITQVTRVEVTQGDQEFKSRMTRLSESPLYSSALLILVDTSQGHRERLRTATMAAVRISLKDLIGQATDQHDIGLYTFSNNLEELAPIGTPLAQLPAHIDKLGATGLGTRMYRNSLLAIEKLAASEADRKAIFIISDAKDEDPGYTLEMLLQSAKEKEITVYALGAPEHGQDIPVLGGLERLAEMTRGIYSQVNIAGGNREIDPELPAKILAKQDAGGLVRADIAGAVEGEPIQVLLHLDNGDVVTFTHEREVVVSVAEEDALEPVETSAEEIETAPEIAEEIVPQEEPTLTDKLLRKEVLIGGGIFIVLMALLAALLTKKKPEIEPEPELEEDFTELEEPLPPPAPAIARITLQDADLTKIDITKEATRIGRTQSNDIVFANNSVSSHHAEIHKKRDGSFVITDLGSGNGTLVNGNEIKQSPLANGDEVEVGEVRFRFESANYRA